MYTFMPKQIEEMIALGRRAGLVKMHLVAGNMPRAQRLCNGIGAAWMPGWTRWLVGAVCPHLVVISLPHDIEYDNGGKVRDRWKSDWHFLTNGLRMAWYCKSRKTAYQAVVLWLCLRLFGAAAFNWKEAK